MRSSISMVLLGTVVFAGLFWMASHDVLPEENSTFWWHSHEIVVFPGNASSSENEGDAKARKSAEGLTFQCWSGSNYYRSFAVARPSTNIELNNRDLLRRKISAALLAEAKEEPPTGTAFDLWFADEPEGKLVLSLIPKNIRR